MLKLENICYKNILRNINLEVQNGEFIYVTGDNGAGKTTLFNIISGIKMPTLGRVMINGRDISEMSLRERTGLIANVLQDPSQGTIAEMTIFENMNVAYKRGKKRLCTVSTTKLRAYFKEKLSILNMGLENRLDDYAGNLSGGQRQALSLIMATIADYEVLLLDEITASLDQKTSALVMNIAHNIAKQDNKVCLAITHRK
ncbi:MAG: ATP-binding cassette domain-containing protein [Alphaproteobacteria bacterium]|nr:ATP-binding cassette domain-containing protein [Alphaproteobacteria bacterium]